jgi:hypothetical protein
LKNKTRTIKLQTKVLDKTSFILLFYSRKVKKSEKKTKETVVYRNRLSGMRCEDIVFSISKKNLHFSLSIEPKNNNFFSNLLRRLLELKLSFLHSTFFKKWIKRGEGKKEFCGGELLAATT